MRNIVRHLQSVRRSVVWSGLIFSLIFSLLSLGCLFVLTDGKSVNRASAQELNKLNRFIQSSNAKDDAMNIFRRGRDQIEEENWSRATTAFNSFVADYPKHKDVDAALYWLAFALKKQGKFADADRQLERLIRDYPQSSWRDDARAMRVEMANRTGNSQAIDNELLKNDHEIKSIALQSLFQSNPERAAAIVADILKPDSKADKRLREHAVMLLGQHPGAKTTPMLLELARNQADPKLRKTAIFWLGQSKDEKVFDFLKETAKQDADPEAAKAALFALSQHSSERSQQLLLELARTASSTKLRSEAIFWLGQKGGETAVNELVTLYDSEQNVEVKKQILFALSQNGNPRALAKLNEIAQSGGNIEYRKQAIFWLGQRGGEQAIANLIQMYDGEKDVQVKDQLIFAFGQSNQKAALQKLIQIAKSDASVELRKKAIFWLGQSKDPEAAKYLEETLK